MLAKFKKQAKRIQEEYTKELTTGLEYAFLDEPVHVENEDYIFDLLDIYFDAKEKLQGDNLEKIMLVLNEVASIIDGSTIAQLEREYC